MIRSVVWLLLLYTLFAPIHLLAQKQIVLLRKEIVLDRYVPGDDFVYRVKGKRHLQVGFVNNLCDTAVVTLTDTVPFHKITRMYLLEPRTMWLVKAVGTLAQGFGIFFMLDDFNKNVIHGKDSDDEQVVRANVQLFIPGTSLHFVRRHAYSMRRRRLRIILVEKGSPLYKEYPAGFESPYIPN